MMKNKRCAALVAMLLLPLAAGAADVAVYEHEDFKGRKVDVDRDQDDLGRWGFAQSASSMLIQRGQWEVCGDANFGGRCVVLGPGRYPSLATLDFNDQMRSIRRKGDASAGGGGGGTWPWQAAEIELFEHAEFGGRSVKLGRAESTLRNGDMNDMVSSIIVRRGNWQVCTDDEFRGRCSTLAPGRYATLDSLGLSDQLSSARPADDQPGGGSDGMITLYENDNFGGRRYDAPADMSDLTPADFNDQASSAVVTRGRWQLCTDAEFRGRCVQLSTGRHASLASLGLNDQVSSVRRLDGGGGAWQGVGGPGAAGGAIYDRPGNARPGSSAVVACTLALQEQVRRERPGATGIEILVANTFEVPVTETIQELRGPGRYRSSLGERRFTFECHYDDATRRVRDVKIAN
jgi:hypothetical protein